MSAVPTPFASGHPAVAIEMCQLDGMSLNESDDSEIDLTTLHGDGLSSPDAGSPSSAHGEDTIQESSSEKTEEERSLLRANSMMTYSSSTVAFFLFEVHFIDLLVSLPKITSISRDGPLLAAVLLAILLSLWNLVQLSESCGCWADKWAESKIWIAAPAFALVTLAVALLHFKTGGAFNFASGIMATLALITYGFYVSAYIWKRRIRSRFEYAFLPKE